MGRRTMFLGVAAVVAAAFGATRIEWPGNALGPPAQIAVQALKAQTAHEADGGGRSNLGTKERAAPTFVSGAAFRKEWNEIAFYVPPDLAVRDGAFDLVVHFNGLSQHQEANVAEAKLHAVVVSVNAGEGSSAYGKKYGGARSLARLVSFAEQQIAVSARAFPKAHVGRVALSSWSAGGGAVHGILEHDAERVDGVLIADGIFSSYADKDKRVVDRKPLEPIIAFAARATRGEKLFVLTHTEIEPTEYPSVKECTSLLIGALGLTAGPPPEDARLRDWGAGTVRYAVEQRGLFIFGFEGTKFADHVQQINALDEAYARLRTRWND